MIICRFEDGGEAKLRHVTANAIVIKEGKILLGKRGTYMGGKPLLEAGKWSLIGGFLSRDETIQQALAREIKEETGWEVKNFTLLHIKDHPDRQNEDRQNVEFVYIVEAVRQEGKSDEEVSKLEWFSPDTIPPEENIAFDHADDLKIYQDYLNKTIPLPYFGKYRII
jgi:8-oxo-dGTP diphosphatase